MAAREPARLVNVPPARRGRRGICAGQRGISVQSRSDLAAPAPFPRYSVFDSVLNRMRDVNWLIFQKHATAHVVGEAQE